PPPRSPPFPYTTLFRSVLRLTEPAFTEITVTGKRVRAGTGASVSALISQSARHNLAGLETLVGIPGSVGGALRTNAGDRSGDIRSEEHTSELQSLAYLV